MSGQDKLTTQDLLEMSQNMQQNAAGGAEQPRKKRKYTKRKKDPNAPKKPRKPRKKKQKPIDKGTENMIQSVSGPVMASMNSEDTEDMPSVPPSQNRPVTFSSQPSQDDIAESAPLSQQFTLPETFTRVPQSVPYYQSREPQPPRPETAQPLDADGVPLDMVEGLKYLREGLEVSNQISLSERLLAKKKEEEEGVEADDSDEEGGEDYEDLMGEFGLDPDEVSLDLGLNEKRQLLLENMDEAQISRYEFFRRTNLNGSSVRKFVSSVIGQNIHGNMAKIIGGVGKMFVGDIVERAKDAQRRQFEQMVAEQIEYKRTLRRCENEDEQPPPPPDFYAELRENSHYPVRSPYTYNNFRVIIPEDSEQLTPDHIRAAWQNYNEESRRIKPEFGRGGLMFK